MPPKFVPRDRKKGRIAKAKAKNAHSHDEPEDANAAEIVPPTPTEREARRTALQEEIRAQNSTSVISGKKKKRLDKYIDNKLKKEENLALIKKLAAGKVDTSLLLSSKKLGRGGESARERLERALREKEQGINLEANDAILFEQRKRPALELESESEDEQASTPQANASQAASAKASVSVPAPAPAPGKGGLFAAGQGLFGSGLKRPLETDEEGKPVIKSRKRTKVVNKSVPAVVQEPEWEGFSGDEGEDGEDDEDEDESSEEDIRDGEEDSDEDDEDDEDSEDAEDSEDGSEEESDSDEDMSDAEAVKEAQKARSSAFKMWATEQRNEAIGFVPSTNLESVNSTGVKQPKNFVPRAPSPETLPPELAVSATTESDNRPAVSLVIPRTPEIQEARLKLPVVQEEQKIMEAVHNNNVLVVWGATGSGKTTQVPQMMFESGYGSKIGQTDGEGKAKGMIGVTQPRRVAAVSVSERVGTELCSMKNRVGYQIRFDTTVSKETAIKFMTDGILLREIANDFILSRYSAIVIDEAHERSVNTDILIGMMSRIVDLRAQMAKEEPEKYYPLKLVIMSATLRITDFTENTRLFRNGPPPIVKAEGRQYPVTDHFARKTTHDYVDDMLHKITRGHKKLPPGGMLCFLTGQQEIIQLAKKLRQAFPADTGSQVKQPRVHVSAADAPLEIDDMDAEAQPATRRNDDDDDDDDSDIEIRGLDDEEDDKEFVIEGEEQPVEALRVHVLPLYSQLPTKQQLKVFEEPPAGSRLIVLATNVAETSLTIPGIRYVFDCGRSKEKKYEASTGVQTFEIDFISKASAAQRAGRAGRTGPGHCYRLYSSAVYERDFEEYAIPEILRSPIEGVVLSLKSMDIQTVVNFPFPTPPDRKALAKAEKLLTFLGAIDAHGKITETGKELAAYPLSPRYARMLLLGRRYNMSAHTIALVASLAVPELFIPQTQYNLENAPDEAESDDENDTARERFAKRQIRSEADNIAASAAEVKRRAYGKAHATLSRWDDRSDALKLLTAMAAYTASSSPATFCTDYFLREKAMKEAAQLKHQLTAIVRSQSRTGTEDPTLLSSSSSQTTLPPPTDKQRAILKQFVAAGFIDQVAVRADIIGVALSRNPRRAIEVPYRTLFASSTGDTAGTDPETRAAAKLSYVHPSSVLARLTVPEMPDYIIYSHLSRQAPSPPFDTLPKTRIHPLTTVTAKQLANLAEGTPLLEVGKPVGKIEQLPRGADGRERREVWVGLSLRGEKESTPWPVGARKVVQKRIGGAWEIEKVVG
ncbi:P-loop containing nucleoside triphosphate hydrolase protein [Aureobasidium subglaciale]|nr:P-loop containing nucleoside triphosphate hydrolase protein [Aureobasidium subglaciale]